MKSPAEMSDEELIAAYNASRGEKVRFKAADIQDQYAETNPHIRSANDSVPFPVTITSTGRSQEENAAVGGVPNSRHLTDDAVDIRTRDLTAEQIQQLIDHYSSQGIKVVPEGDHLHIETNKPRPESEYAGLSDGELTKLYLQSIQSKQNEAESSVAGQNQENGVSFGDKARSFLSGMGRALPGSDLASAFGQSEVSRIGRTLHGEHTTPKQWFEDFKGNYSRFKAVQDAIESKAPGYALAGSLPPTMAEYFLGTKALTGPMSAGGGTLGKVLAGGVTNLGVAQGQAPDASRVGTDLAFGAGGELLGAGMGALGKYLMPKAKNYGSRLIESTLRRGDKALQLEKAKTGQVLGEDLFDRGVFGSHKKMAKVAGERLSSNEAQLQNVLSNTKGKVSAKSVADEVLGELDQYSGVAGEAGNVGKVKGIAEEVAAMGDMSARDANVVKRKIYAQLEPKYNSLNPDSATISGQKAQARGIKKEIERLAPESAPINRELSVYGRLDKALKTESAKSFKKNFLSPWNFAAPILGGLGGAGFTGGDGGTGLGTAIGMYALSTPWGRNAIARGLHGAHKYALPNMAGVRYAGPIGSAISRGRQKKGQE